jgi:hypothetical protein
MITTNDLHCKKLAVVFQKQGLNQPRFVKNRVAQSLLWLVYRQEAGVTAAEVSSWALRLADYIHTLRWQHGIQIQTLMEPHDGGKHARYVLREPVEVLEITPTK